MVGPSGPLASTIRKKSRRRVWASNIIIFELARRLEFRRPTLVRLAARSDPASQPMHSARAGRVFIRRPRPRERPEQQFPGRGPGHAPGPVVASVYGEGGPIFQPEVAAK